MRQEMRPALQKLLARPSSLEILRSIITAPTLADVRNSLCSSQFRLNANGTLAAASENVMVSEQPFNYNKVHRIWSCTDHHELTLKTFTTSGILDGLPIVAKSNSLRKKWDKKFWTIDELEFESDVFQPTAGKQRLVDNPEFGEDINLWAFLWRYRTKTYGDSGVAMFWKAIRSRGLDLPVEEPLAAGFWRPILELGFKDKAILSDVWSYISELYEASGKRWRKLYCFVMEYIVLNRGQEDIMIWHRRLYEHHRPSPAGFSRLFRKLSDKIVDLEVLKQIYIENTHHNVYSKIVPTFLRKEQYQTALDWHFLLIKYGDLPSTEQEVEPLIKQFAAHDLSKAKSVARSLDSAGVSVPTSILEDLEDSIPISRETMNVIHGKTFNVRPKIYSDKLGSRWLATTWVPLDVAIESLHSLGIKEIGPLSLQAIALRETDSRRVVYRLNQLQELGISVGSSAFSKAVESFARTGEVEHLHSLLTSDQHPDSLGDLKLQESLLASFVLVGDRVRYAHTLAVLLVGASDPQIKEYNIILRCNISNWDLPSILQIVENMRIKRIPVQQITINYLLKKLLAPREKQKPPPRTPGDVQNLFLAISILRFIRDSGWRVAADSWHEVIRRLGQLGRLDDLDNLCIWLARKHMGGSISQQITPHLLRLQNKPHRLSAQVTVSDTPHPLDILFPASLQRAIVEWAFVHEQSTTASRRANIPYNEEYRHTRGLKLLRQLSMEGVNIHRGVVRKALITRLDILYGPGESQIARNRRAKARNTVTQKDMITSFNEAFAEEILPR